LGGYPSGNTEAIDKSGVDDPGFQRRPVGRCKDHRPDLAQLKVMLARLDPVGGPVVTQVVSGNRADDKLYNPAIDETRAVLGQRGLLYVGDSKMEALSTRAHLVAGGDYYLPPLSLKGAQTELLAELAGLYLWRLWLKIRNWSMSIKSQMSSRRGG
jgi:hypothetical protein